MIRYVKRACTKFGFKCDDWAQALLEAGRLLEESGDINHQYSLDMVELIKTNGPYIVVMPHVALAHARPKGNVYHNAISIVTLENPVSFGHSLNDPVNVVIAIAAKTDNEHLQLFQCIANYLMDENNVKRIVKANSIEDVIGHNRLFDIDGGLIVSCYADQTINEYMDNDEAMKCVALSCVKGGASVIRTNLEHVSAIKSVVDVPIIGIKKIYKGNDPLNSSFRITPTMKEVDELVAVGVDGIAIDGTIRERYDDLTLEQFVKQIKEKYPNLFVIADISTLEEGIKASEYGVDAVGTTLSGYTPYSKNPILFGTVPSPDPDYEIIQELHNHGVKRVIAEGRINDGHKMRKCLDASAYAVVIGTSITEPKKIVKTILFDAKQR